MHFQVVYCSLQMNNSCLMEAVACHQRTRIQGPSSSHMGSMAWYLQAVCSLLMAMGWKEVCWENTWCTIPDQNWANSINLKEKKEKFALTRAHTVGPILEEEQNTNSLSRRNKRLKFWPHIWIRSSHSGCSLQEKCSKSFSAPNWGLATLLWRLCRDFHFCSICCSDKTITNSMGYMSLWYRFASYCKVMLWHPTVCQTPCLWYEGRLSFQNAIHSKTHDVSGYSWELMVVRLLQKFTDRHPQAIIIIIIIILQVFLWILHALISCAWLLQGKVC